MMKRTINQLTTYDFSVVWILGAITVAPLLDGDFIYIYNSSINSIIFGTIL